MLLFPLGSAEPCASNLLSARFDHVGICLDVQAFAESHRRQLATQRLIKPCFDDRALQDVPSHAEDCGNIDVDAAGIVGMPFETPSHRERAISYIEALMKEYECVRDWRFSPLHVIPGTPLQRRPGFTTCRSSVAASATSSPS